MKKLLTMVLALVASVLLIGNVSALTTTSLTKDDVTLKEATGEDPVGTPSHVQKWDSNTGERTDYLDKVTITYSELTLDVVDYKEAASFEFKLGTPDTNVGTVTGVTVDGTKLASPSGDPAVKVFMTPADLQKTMDKGSLFYTKDIKVVWTVTCEAEECGTKQELNIQQIVTLKAHVSRITLNDKRTDADSENPYLWNEKIAAAYAKKIGFGLAAVNDSTEAPESTDSSKKDDVPKTGNSFSMALIGMMAVGAIATISFKKCEE